MIFRNSSGSVVVQRPQIIEIGDNLTLTDDKQGVITITGEAGGGGGGTDDQIASEVPFTPTGTITATDVQAAIAELVAEVNSGLHNHTASAITDFDTAVEANAAVTANTAKVTNATHTGEVTGATALTVNSAAISNKTLKSNPSGNEEVLINDAGTLKKTTVQDIADLGAGNSGLTFTENTDGFAIAGGSVSERTLTVLGGNITLTGGANTKGDILVGDGTNYDNLAIGTNGQVLTADSTQARGVKWATPTGGSGHNITSGSGAPSSTPAAVGDEYLDTTNNRLYKAFGTSSYTDWRYVDTTVNPYTPPATDSIVFEDGTNNFVFEDANNAVFES